MGKDLTDEIWVKAAAATEQPIVVTDREMRVVGVNQAMEKLLGWQSHELVGEKICSVVACRDNCGNLPILKTVGPMRA